MKIMKCTGIVTVEYKCNSCDEVHHYYSGYEITLNSDAIRVGDLDNMMELMNAINNNIIQHDLKSN